PVAGSITDPVNVPRAPLPAGPANAPATPEFVGVGAEALGALSDMVTAAGDGSAPLGRFGAQGRPSRFDTYGVAAATPSAITTSSTPMPPKIRPRRLRFRGGAGGGG